VSMLDRMRELAVRASSETLSDSDRDNANLEFIQLHEEITRVSISTTFNGEQLLAGTKFLTFQVGFVNDTSNRIVATLQGGMGAATLGVSIEVASAGAAQSALAAISGALGTVNAYRSKLGSVQNRLERSIGNLESDIENSVASNSRIRDVDFAAETSRMTRLQILTQSGTSVLSQANAAPQAALALLG
jgi:flagellin